MEKLTTALGKTRLVELTPGMIQSVLARHWGHTGPANRTRVCSAIGGVPASARRHNLMKERVYLPRPRGSAGRDTKVNKWLYPDEIALLLSCMPGQIKLPVKVIFLQGRRPSEILYREWEDLSLRPGRETLRLGETKGQQDEVIALDREVAKDLRALASNRRGRGLPLSGRTFLNAHGEPWHDPGSRCGLPINKPFRQARDRAAKRLLELADQAGLDVDRRDFLRERAEVMRPVTAYWGRHNFVSHHVAGQTPGQAISEMVGWTSLAMLPRYSHLSDAHLRQSLAKVRITETEGDDE